MPRHGEQKSEERFAAFIEALVDVIGHVDRASPLPLATANSHP